MSNEKIEQLLGHLTLKVFEANLIGDEELTGADDFPLATLCMRFRELELTVYTGGHENGYPVTEHIKTEYKEPIKEEDILNMLCRVEEMAECRKKKIVEVGYRKMEEAKAAYERLSQQGQ